MTSLEQAKACAEELQREFGGRYFAANIEQQEAIIQKHIDAFAKTIQEGDIYQDLVDALKEIDQLKETNRELLKDKERLDWLQQNGSTGYWYEAYSKLNEPFAAIRLISWNETSEDGVSDNIREALDKAALSKERTE